MKSFPTMVSPSLPGGSYRGVPGGNTSPLKGMSVVDVSSVYPFVSQELKTFAG